MDVSDHAARFCGGAVCSFMLSAETLDSHAGESATRLRYQQCGFLLAGRAILAGGLVKLRVLSFPNAFFGIAAESVFVTIA